MIKDVKGKSIVRIGSQWFETGGLGLGLKPITEGEANNLFVQGAQLAASDPVQLGYFGTVIQMSSDTIAISAVTSSSEEPAVYMFELQDDLWVETQKLVVEDLPENSGFGTTIALGNDVLVVGVSGDSEVDTSAGAAYIFEKVDGTWIEAQKLLASDGASGDAFGIAVCMSDDQLLVGAEGVDGEEVPSQGAIYVFEEQDGTWVETQKLIRDDETGTNMFGRIMSASEDILVVGTRQDETYGTSAGAAYIFEKQNGVWAQSQLVFSSDLVTGDYFGDSVAVGNGFVFVGSYGDDDNGSNSGSVYVFEKQDDVWTEVQKILPSNGEASARFGRNISVSENTLVITAPGQSNYTGSVYVFENQDGTWIEVEEIISPDGIDMDNFGVSVSILDNRLAVMTMATYDEIIMPGTVYLFNRSQL